MYVIIDAFSACILYVSGDNCNGNWKIQTNVFMCACVFDSMGLWSVDRYTIAAESKRLETQDSTQRIASGRVKTENEEEEIRKKKTCGCCFFFVVVVDLLLYSSAFLIAVGLGIYYAQTHFVSVRMCCMHEWMLRTERGDKSTTARASKRENQNDRFRWGEQCNSATDVHKYNFTNVCLRWIASVYTHTHTVSRSVIIRRFRHK